MNAFIRYASAALVTAALAIPGGRADAQPARTPDTDQTVPVTRGTQLFVNNFAGEVVVQAWQQDQVRVQARHSSHVRVNVRTAENAVRLSSASSSGTPSVDYDIRVPAWMSVRVNGQFDYIEVDGTQADVYAENVRGDIHVKGGSGVVSLKSIEGEITAEDTKGRLTVSSVNESIALLRPSGEISAETINGEITFTDARANSVEVTTVNGDVRYTGLISDNGLYRFNTHQGDILIGVQDRVNATVSIRSYQGDFRSSFPFKAENTARGRRQTFTVGTGSAQIELESFGGDIRLLRTSEMPPEKKEKDKSKDER
ncbi:MAG: DUF4097 family beta strand repeat-containing protein [Acidobacteriota bacterium]